LSGLSAVRHGFFRVGFMLCDRCVLNVRCGRFSPGGECVFEREVFDRVVEDFTEAYGLDMFADRLSVELIAMDVVRLMRAWNYDAVRGFASEFEVVGNYVSRLEKSLRKLLNDLAVNRGRREKSEGLGGLLTDVKQVIERSAVLSGRREKMDRRRIARIPRKLTSKVSLHQIYLTILEDFEEHETSLKRIRRG